MCPLYMSYSIPHKHLHQGTYLKKQLSGHLGISTGYPHFVDVTYNYDYKLTYTAARPLPPLTRNYTSTPWWVLSLVRCPYLVQKELVDSVIHSRGLILSLVEGKDCVSANHIRFHFSRSKTFHTLHRVHEMALICHTLNNDWFYRYMFRYPVTIETGLSWWGI